ncbi:uncharacterized protein LOC141674323 [Apium graveolens]|uniref:uncharacterized protein LOC141674323 n=1 Tax=Apium graveolens TaxID=4045 RepID=UPI003D78F829
MDPSKIHSIMSWPIPDSIKALRGFLGLSGYYRRFIKGYGMLTRPLTELLKKDVFYWDEATTITFKFLKQAPCAAPVLVMPNFDIPFIVEIDACATATLFRVMATWEERHKSQISEETVSDLNAISELQPVWVQHVETTIKKQGKTYVESNGEIRNQVIAALHNSSLGGHSGQTACVQRMKLLFFWPNMKKDVDQWIQKCEVCQRYKAYHPQSDGQTERSNRCLETFLRCFSGDRSGSWKQWLSMAEYWYNTSFQTSIRITPHEALYDIKSIPINLGNLSDMTLSIAQDLLSHMEQVLHQLKDNLLKAQHIMKFYSDRKLIERVFSKGDWVFLKLQPYKQKSLAERVSLKLSVKFFGPFQVEEKVGAVAYKLRLPAHSKPHTVFHITLLKKLLAIIISLLQENCLNMIKKMSLSWSHRKCCREDKSGKVMKTLFNG